MPTLIICPVYSLNFYNDQTYDHPNQIVFTIMRLIWHQTDFRLVLNQSDNGKYNPISVFLT